MRFLRGKIMEALSYRSSLAIVKRFHLPEVDQYGNVIKKQLSPCERGDSRYQLTSYRECVPNPTRVKGGVQATAVPAAVPAAKKQVVSACPPYVLVHVWKSTYASMAYVLGPTHAEAKQAATCIGNVVHIDGSVLPAFAGGTFDSYWKGSGYHVVFPHTWYEALKNIGVKGIPL